MEWIQYRGLTYNGHIIQQFYCLVRMPLYIDNRDCSSQKRQSKTQYLDLYIFIFYCIFFIFYNFFILFILDWNLDLM